MLDAFNIQSVIYGCRIAQVINKPVYVCEHIAPVRYSQQNKVPAVLFIMSRIN